MAVYLVSGNSDYELDCPFGITYIAPVALKSPVTHMKFVAAQSTVIVDLSSDYDTTKLPISVDSVNVVPLIPKECYTNKLIAYLTHMYPQHASLLRRGFMFGEENFRDTLHGLAEALLWDKTISTYLPGMEACQ